jgi:hypothetical protein
MPANAPPAVMEKLERLLQLCGGASAVPGADQIAAMAPRVEPDGRPKAQEGS